MKDQGGLGILSLDVQNKFLLSKWLFRLINENGVWQQLLWRKYLRHKTIIQVEYMPKDYHFWSGLMNIKTDFLRLGIFQLGNGAQIRFWEDTWLGNMSFKCQYPSLYNIVRKKSDFVSIVFRSNPLHVAFRRSLVDNNLRQCQQLVAKVVDVQLHDRDDRFI